MLISLRTDTNQYDSSRMQLGPVRTDTTWNGPVRTNTTWNGPVRLNRDELLATKCRAHPCLIASLLCPSKKLTSSSPSFDAVLYYGKNYITIIRS